MSLLVSKNEVSTNSLAWSFVINPTLRPFSFKRFATSHRRLVFPAPKNPPTKIKSVLEADEINVTHEISLIATVGERMKNTNNI